VAVAESIHQVVAGNIERGAGRMDSLRKGGFPPEPDVVNHSADGPFLPHRVGCTCPSMQRRRPMPHRALIGTRLDRWLSDHSSRTSRHRPVA